MPISLVLADSHPLMLGGMQQLFARETDFAVLACCSDGEEALRAVRRQQPDILILDLRLPDQDGLAVIAEIQRERLPVRCIVLTAALEEAETVRAIRLGVRGIVLKNMPTHLLVRCIRKVHAGSHWLETLSATRILDATLRREAEAQSLAQVLTAREIQITRMISEGARNKEVAQCLDVAEGTIKSHLHKIYQKLKLKGRFELMHYAQKQALS